MSYDNNAGEIDGVSDITLVTEARRSKGSAVGITIAVVVALVAVVLGGLYIFGVFGDSFGEDQDATAEGTYDEGEGDTTNDTDSNAGSSASHSQHNGCDKWDSTFGCCYDDSDECVQEQQESSIFPPSWRGKEVTISVEAAPNTLKNAAKSGITSSTAMYGALYNGYPVAIPYATDADLLPKLSGVPKKLVEEGAVCRDFRVDADGKNLSAVDPNPSSKNVGKKFLQTIVTGNNDEVAKHSSLFALQGLRLPDTDALTSLHMPPIITAVSSSNDGNEYAFDVSYQTKPPNANSTWWEVFPPPNPHDPDADCDKRKDGMWKFNGAVQLQGVAHWMTKADIIPLEPIVKYPKAWSWPIRPTCGRLGTKWQPPPLNFTTRLVLRKK